jgi:hypothetical protein
MEAEMEAMRKEHEEQFKQFEQIEKDATAATSPIATVQEPSFNPSEATAPAKAP